MNVYFQTVCSRNAKRVLRKLTRDLHAPIERLGSTRHQYGDGLLTAQNVCSKLDLK